MFTIPLTRRGLTLPLGQGRYCLRFCPALQGSPQFPRVLDHMPLRLLLTRLFLVVTLSANGLGIAGASMHVEHLRDSAGYMTDDAAVQISDGAVAGCHGTAADGTPADDHRQSRGADQAGVASPLGDCYRGGDCCACMHHCSATLVRPALVDFTGQYRQIAEPFLSGHASATLATLLRPPIR